MHFQRVFLLLIIAAFNASVLTSGQVLDKTTIASNRKVGACHIEQFAVYHALAEVAQKTSTPIGIDTIQPSKEKTVTLDFPGGTLADLLNMFVSQNPDYRWSEADSGVIHVSRVSGHVPLLDVMMQYPGANQTTREEIWNAIGTQPEIAAWMNSSHCSRQEFFQGNEFRNNNNRISIPAGTLSLTQLLDYVAVKSGENYWAVLESPIGAPCRISLILW